jgi:hypothetical protein
MGKEAFQELICQWMIFSVCLVICLMGKEAFRDLVVSVAQGQEAEEELIKVVR